MVSIKPNDVYYLSLEGGGGKGAVYLGVLAAFAQLGIMKEVSKGSGDYTLGWPDQQTVQVLGISGASAGAITAALLASGHTTNDFFKFMTGGVLNEFYDPATSTPGDARLIPNVNPDPSNKTGCQIPTSDPDDIVTNSLIPLLSNPASIGLIKIIITKLIKSNTIPDALGKALLSDPKNYILDLILDFGLFSGCKARDVIDEMISNKVKEKQIANKVKVTNETGITFQRFFDIFNKDIKLTGSNISNMKSVYFSRQTTKDFRVADAVRISMSFPGAFKPVRVPGNSNIDGVSPGVWIDGGLLNNNPLHAFDESSGLINKNILGLRIGQDQRNDIQNIVSFVSAILSTIFASPELGQIRSTEEKERTINLDENGLSTLDFSPTPAILKKAVTSAGSTVLQAFGVKPGVIYQKILTKWGMYP